MSGGPLRTVAAIMAALGLGTGVACRQDEASSRQGEIVVLCAAALRVPVEEAARAFHAAGGARVELQYGGSQSLLSTLAIARAGDVFLPADRSYLVEASSRGFVAREVPLTSMRAAVAVARGNPKGIRALADLRRRDVRLVLANPDIAAISNLTSRALPASEWRSLATHAIVMKPTVSDVANDIALGAADAGIVWDVTVMQSPALEAVDVPELRAVAGEVSGGLAAHSSRGAAAAAFLEWLAAPDKGGAIFRRHGYGSGAGS